MATGRRYNGFYNSACGVGSTTAALWNLLSTAAVRPKVYEINTGCDATPADQAQKFAFYRTTANFGTPGAAVVGAPLDQGDPVAVTTFQTPGGTAVTQTGVTPLQWAQNQRANFRWIAAPDSEIVIPASATGGLALMCPVSTASSNYSYNVMWAE
jgi:hypothetical protein